MIEASRYDTWRSGDDYDQYMGRWSRKVAPLFLDWLDQPDGLSWLEVGCGTGALTDAIVRLAKPKSLLAVDRSPGFLAQARINVPHQDVGFEVADAQELPVPEAERDVVVSGLMLNFVPDRPKALAAMRHAVRDDGVIAFYVWDYPGGGVEFMRIFWSVATTLDPQAESFTETARFQFCTQQGLMGLARESGLAGVESVALDADTVFTDFADYWRPFTLGAGPAPGYCASLTSDAREQLRLALSEALPRQEDGSIRLRVRAWGVKGRRLGTA